MAWAEKQLKRNAFNEIVPQYFDEVLDDWVPYTGVYGEVTLSGTNVLLAEGDTVVAAGAIVTVTNNISVADVREVYAYAGKAQANTPWKLEIRFISHWSGGSGWDFNVSYQDYVVESTAKNAYIEPVKCVSSTVRLIIENNHTQDVTFRWRLGGLR